MDNGLSLALGAIHLARAASTPSPTFDTLVLEGDSQTSMVPETYSGSLWAYRWRDAHPGLTIHIPAQASRTIGGPAVTGPPAEGGDTGSPSGNTLLLHQGDDLALDPDAIVFMIGSNDLGTYTVPTVLARLAAYTAPIRAAGVKVLIATPPPYDSRHVNHATFNARRLDYLAAMRSDWRDYCDALIPFGDHPLLNTGEDPHPLISDGVHLTAYDAVTPDNGHNLLEFGMDAGMSPITDTSRYTAIAPSPGDWFGSNDTVTAGGTTERSYLVTGLGLGVEAPVTLTSSDGATMRRGYAAFGEGTFTVVNGDVVTLRLPHSANPETATSATVQIGSGSDTLTLTTPTAAQEPVTYTHGGIVSDPNPATTKVFSDLTFGEGLAIVAITSQSSYANSVTINPGGIAATLVHQQARSGNRGLQVWVAPITEARSDYSATIVRGASSALHIMCYGTSPNTSGVASAAGSAPANQSPPHLVPSLTVPENGLLLAWLMEEGGATITPATCNSPTEFIAEGNTVYQSATTGLAMGKRTSTGQASFQFAFGSFARAGVVLAPA